MGARWKGEVRGGQRVVVEAQVPAESRCPAGRLLGPVELRVLVGDQRPVERRMPAERSIPVEPQTSVECQVLADFRVSVALQELVERQEAGKFRVVAKPRRHAEHPRMPVGY